MRACDVMLHHSGLRGQREGRYRALHGWDVESSESLVGKLCKVEGVGGVRQFFELEGPLNRAGLQCNGSACCGLSQALVTAQNGLQTAKNEPAAVWE